jgi:PTS system mannose-specific IIB component
MKIEGVDLVRIDDRLIHGQVMTSWLNYIGANKIMVIDDNVSEDPFLINMLKNCIPGNIKLAVFSIEKAADRLKIGFKNDHCIILVKYPSTLKHLMEKGIVFEDINIGGMGILAGRKKFYKNISVTEEEKEIFKSLISAGSQIFIRIIAEDNSTDISKLI